MRIHAAVSLSILALRMLAASPLLAAGLADFAAAKQQAEKQKRPVLLEFGTEW